MKLESLIHNCRSLVADDDGDGGFSTGFRSVVDAVGNHLDADGVVVSLVTPRAVVVDRQFSILEFGGADALQL